VLFEPLDFIARLTALMPKPRVDLTRFHGVFAPNSAHRAQVTKAGRGKGATGQATTQTAPNSPPEPRAGMTWAQRLERVFDIDLQSWPACGGALRILASIEDPAVIEKILDHLDAKAAAAQAARRPPCRGPRAGRSSGALDGAELPQRPSPAGRQACGCVNAVQLREPWPQEWLLAEHQAERAAQLLTALAQGEGAPDARRSRTNRRGRSNSGLSGLYPRTAPGGHAGRRAPYQAKTPPLSSGRKRRMTSSSRAAASAGCRSASGATLPWNGFDSRVSTEPG
jgi:hypothetical protein